MINMLQICTLQSLHEELFEADKNEGGFETEISDVHAAALAVLHIASIFGLFLCLSGNIFWTTLFYHVIVGYVCVSALDVGAHSLWCRRSFKATFTLRLALLMAQTAAGPYSVWEWVRDHRQHHRYMKTNGDPFNSKKGIFFSHIGWLILKRGKEATEKGQLIDMSDLNTDPLIMLQKKYFPYLLVLSVALQCIIPWFIWNEGLWVSIAAFAARTTLVLHYNLSIYSFPNFYGNMAQNNKLASTDDKGDEEKTNSSCNCEEFDSEFLQLFERLGLAYEVNRPKKEV